jgi:hypothetical protein
VHTANLPPSSTWTVGGSLYSIPPSLSSYNLSTSYDMSTKPPAYISKSGTLTNRPLTVRAKDYAVGWYTLFFLFWQTLLMVRPI